MTTELKAAESEIAEKELPFEGGVVEALAIAIAEDDNQTNCVLRSENVGWWHVEIASDYAKRLQKLGFSIVRTSTLRDTRNGVYNLRTDKDVD